MFHRFVAIAICYCVVAAVSCHSPNGTGNADALFQLMPADQTGIDFSNQVTDTKDFNIFSYRNFYNGAGVAVGDVNNDGLPDIFFTSNQQQNKLYINKGNWQFEDVTARAGLQSRQHWHTGANMVDINGDNWLDIYVCNSGEVPGDDHANELYINQRNGTFKESAHEFGLDDKGLSTQAAFFDYDNDGDLDCFVLAVVSIYWFIPSQLTVVQITPVHCPATAAFRSLSNKDAWRIWWPSKDTTDHTLQYGNSSYQITKTLLNTFDVQVQHAGLTLNSTINLLPLPNDSMAIQWKCTIPSGMNPFTRIQRYRQAIAVKNNMAAVSNAFRSFAGKKENLYGISIRETSIKDTLLIAYKIKSPVYPNTTAIYTLVQLLKKYISDQQAAQTGYPMVNITPLDSSAYQLMVAIPVNKRLPDKGPFFQRYLVPGKFLFTTIQGGPGGILHTFKQLQLYVDDYRRTAMAIPFQLLVTDRSAEPDTNKWITHIYVPVM